MIGCVQTCRCAIGQGRRPSRTGYRCCAAVACNTLRRCPKRVSCLRGAVSRCYCCVRGDAPTMMYDRANPHTAYATRVHRIWMQQQHELRCCLLQRLNCRSVEHETRSLAAEPAERVPHLRARLFLRCPVFRALPARALGPRGRRCVSVRLWTPGSRPQCNTGSHGAQCTVHGMCCSCHALRDHSA